MDATGDVILQTQDGTQIRAHGQILQLSSSVFRHAPLWSPDSHPSKSLDKIALNDDDFLQETCKVKVDGSEEDWMLLLKHLYPSYPRPIITLESAFKILPLAHKYDIGFLLDELSDFLSDILPSRLTLDDSSSASLTRWLNLADDLQMDALKKICITKVKDLAHHRQLDSCLEEKPSGIRFPSGLTQHPTSSQPEGCPSRYFNHHGKSCSVWCSSCNLWRCAQSNSMFIGGACTWCGSLRIWKPDLEGRWYKSDQPSLTAAMKQLSKGTLEEILAVVISVSSKQYVHCEAEVWNDPREGSP